MKLRSILKIETAAIVGLVIGVALLGVGMTNMISTPRSLRSATEAEQYRMSALQIFATTSRGSAVYMDKNLALSAAHVCFDISPGSSKAVDYKGNELDIESAELNEAIDICVIKLKDIKAPMPTRKLAKKSLFLLGKTVITAGFPGGQYYSIQFATVRGIQIVAVQGSADPKYVSMIDTYVAPGGSGSGAFNDNGEVAGIVIVSSPMYGVTGLVPLVDIHEFLKESALGNALVE
jgi:S1-C subfamily serine protease